MGPDKVIEFTRLTRGTVVANHLEALSSARPRALRERLRIPAAGERWPLRPSRD